MTITRKWTKRFRHKKITYTACFTQRAFREGLEVSLNIGEKTIKISELGLGEKALLEKIKSEIDIELLS